MIVDPTDFAARFDVSRETLEKLSIYVALLEKWQQRVNLVANSTLSETWQRHIWDSAQLVGLLDQDSPHILDIGSGAGFPGLVLAIMTEADLCLVESDQKKCIFLQTVIRECGLKADVRNLRVETLPPEGADIITARALASVDRLLDLLAKQFTRETRCLFLKGARVHAEIACLKDRPDIDWKLHPSLTNPDAFVLDLTVRA